MTSLIQWSDILETKLNFQYESVLDCVGVGSNKNILSMDFILVLHYFPSGLKSKFQVQHY